MLPAIIIPILSLLSLASAFTCDASNAMTLEQAASAAASSTSGSASDTGSDTDLGSGSGSGVCLYADCPYCGSDPSGLLCQNWHQTQLQGDFNAVANQGSSLYGSIGKRLLQSRDSSLECADADVCLTAGGAFLCVDAESLDFEDSNGGNGNLDSDVYTMANGDVTSVASTVTALPTPTAKGKEADSTGTATEVGSKATASSGSSASASAATGTSQVTGSGAGNIKVNSVLGTTLLVMGGAFMLV